MPRCDCGAEELGRLTRIHALDGLTHSRDACVPGGTRLMPPSQRVEVAPSPDGVLTYSKAELLQMAARGECLGEHPGHEVCRGSCSLEAANASEEK